MSAQPLTLGNYYRQFKSLSGVLAGATSAGPLLSAVLPAPAYAFPPLGDVGMLARCGAVLLALMMTYVAFFFGEQKNRRAMRYLVGVAVFGLIFYLGACMAFVRRIDIPTQNSTMYVSVGYERQPWVKEPFVNDTDWDILKARGTDDKEIFHLWIKRSVIVARLTLFASFCSFLLSLVLLFSLGVRYQMDHRQPL